MIKELKLINLIIIKVFKENILVKVVVLVKFFIFW